ncbi:hypothetical protein FA15DRAFT_708873 [Coprinopsis marcescibilis]|uniref:DUF6533 domain-containing protein n=1 Tax=Coprinopsis marcescibilis TaxID=230819 RepID=A0A5C3KI06_COPMA|nr:hypothetical protein FA15DRAFT_708873 [Coprinopsis marcescibilis]
MDQATESAIQVLGQKQAFDYVQAAVLSFLISDYLETLPLELKYVWPSRWNSVKIVFLVARYSPFFDVAVLVAFEVARNMSALGCHVLLGFGGSVIFVGVTFSEVILFIRVYAVSSRSRLIKWYLISHFVIVHLVKVVTMMIFAFTIQYETDPMVIRGSTQCHMLIKTPRFADHLFTGAFAMFVVSGTVIVLIMSWLSFQRFRSDGTNLVSIFFRDGVFYFMILTGISIVNIVVNIVFAPQFNYLLPGAQSVFHSTLSTRMVLRLRETADLQTGNKQLQFIDGHPQAEMFEPSRTQPIRFQSRSLVTHNTFTKEEAINACQPIFAVPRDRASIFWTLYASVHSTVQSGDDGQSARLEMAAVGNL